MKSNVMLVTLTALFLLSNLTYASAAKTFGTKSDPAEGFPEFTEPAGYASEKKGITAPPGGLQITEEEAIDTKDVKTQAAAATPKKKEKKHVRAKSDSDIASIDFKSCCDAHGCNNCPTGYEYPRNGRNGSGYEYPRYGGGGFGYEYPKQNGESGYEYPRYGGNGSGYEYPRSDFRSSPTEQQQRYESRWGNK